MEGCVSILRRAWVWTSGSEESRRQVGSRCTYVWIVLRIRLNRNSGMSGLWSGKSGGKAGSKQRRFPLPDMSCLHGVN